MSYPKSVLADLGNKAAADHLSNGTDLTEAVVKVARKHPLTTDQIERVCNSANLSVNKSLMEKSAYTTFPTAKSEDVVKALGSEVKTAGFFDFGLSAESVMDKTASTEEGLIEKLAQFYGVEYHETGIADQDAHRMVQALGAIGLKAADGFCQVKEAANVAFEDLYREARVGLLSGMPREAVVSQVMDASPEYAADVFNRLEADALLPASEIDDQGPNSLQRMYKEAGITVEFEGDPIGAIGATLDEVSLDGRLHLEALGASYDVLSAMTDHPSEYIKTAASRLLDQLNASASLVLENSADNSVRDKIASYWAEVPQLGKDLAGAGADAIDGIAGIGSAAGRWFNYGGGMNAEKLRRAQDIIEQGNKSRTSFSNLTEGAYGADEKILNRLRAESKAGHKAGKDLQRRKDGRFLRGLALVGGGFAAKNMVDLQRERMNQPRTLPL